MKDRKDHIQALTFVPNTGSIISLDIRTTTSVKKYIHHDVMK